MFRDARINRVQQSDPEGAHAAASLQSEEKSDRHREREPKNQHWAIVKERSVTKD
jgi:hypothetical protein